MVTAATIYMSLLGFVGLSRVAAKSHENTSQLVAGLCSIDGVERLFSGPHFHEVALRLNRPVAPVLTALAEQDVLGGFDLSTLIPEQCDALLVCATETKTDEDIDVFVNALREILGTEAN